jgi:hypothetical protein
VEDLIFGDLKVQVEDDAARAAFVLKWTGKSHDRQPGKKLDPFLGAAAAAAAEQARSLELRFEKLEYFNSSTLTSIIGLVQQARHRKVPVVIVFDKAMKWQKLAFDALRVLGKGDGLLEIRAA